VIQYECQDCSHRGVDEECEACGSGMTLKVRVTPCPNGVTVAMWRAGVTTGCTSDEHEWKTGEHVEQVDD